MHEFLRQNHVFLNVFHENTRENLIFQWNPIFCALHEQEDAMFIVRRILGTRRRGKRCALLHQLHMHELRVYSITKLVFDGLLASSHFSKICSYMNRHGPSQKGTPIMNRVPGPRTPQSNRHGPPQKGTPIMNRIPGPRTPHSNVESGVEDDQ